MGFNSNIIVFAIPPQTTASVFEDAHKVLTENHFEWDTESNHIRLESIDTDDEMDFLFGGADLKPKTLKEWEGAITRLKTNRTGGYLHYRGIADKFKNHVPYDVLVAFNSLDNYTIECISISSGHHIYRYHEEKFEILIQSILQKMEIIGVAQGYDYEYNSVWHETEVAEMIKLGKLKDVYPKLVHTLKK